jgi:hypothetical protein
MKRLRSILVGLIVCLVHAGPAHAQESGGFVVRLGRDTTGVERYSRSKSRVVIDQVGRSPRVLVRRIEFELGPSGRPRRATIRVTEPGAPADAKPVQMVTAQFTADSAMVETRRDTSVTKLRVAVPPRAVVIGSTPWSIYEQQTMRLARAKSDTLGAPLYQIGSTSVGWLSVRRLGRDSMVIQTQNDRYHARVDVRGNIIGVVPISGTQQVSVDRAPRLDFPALTASFAAREKQGGAMGALSPRDTVQATVAGANLMVDYSRPSKRGRTIFGTVVPWGQLWRTGANAATQFRTDKTLVIGGVEVPAGFYTLWTIPNPQGWKLVINSETGQAGTAHNAEKDLYTIDMTVGAIDSPVERFTIAVVPQGAGGALNFEWDTTRASVPFTVKE